MAEDPDGTLRPRITDFGVSSFADASVSRSTGLMGTPGYLAPEVAQGRRADSAADVYALGVILYELCAGRAPFVAEHAMALIRAHADDAVQRPAGLPDPVWAVLERLLAKDPVQRPTAEQAAQLLRGAVGAAGDPAGETLLPAPALNGGHGGHGGHAERAGHGVAPAPEDAATVYRIGTVPPPPAPGRDLARGRPRRPRVVVAAAAATAAVLVAAAGYLAVTLANGGDRDGLALTTTTSAPGATPSPSSASATSATSAGSPATSAPAPAASTPAVAAPPGASAAPSPGHAPAAQAPAPRVTVVAQQKAAPPAAGPATVVVTAQPAPQPVSASSLASVALRDGARLYFGRLDRVLGAAGVRFRVDPSYRAGHPSQCAVTVVVRGVSGSTGAVFASGLGTGWAAAESAPDQSVAADGGVLHQQVVVPPGSTSVGQTWTLQSSMTVDGANTYLGSARLRVTGEDDDGLLWTVGGTTVRCTSG